jgi:uncharacterized membrane protein
MSHQHRHPVNRKLLDDAPTGARVADAVTAFLGSWRFIVLQTVIVAAWIAINVYHLFNATFDPYPFILLNLAFSTQAAYAAPLILLAGNRSALRDRMTLEHAAAEADVEERQNAALLAADEQILARLDEVMRRLERLGPDGR